MAPFLKWISEDEITHQIKHDRRSYTCLLKVIKPISISLNPFKWIRTKCAYKLHFDFNSVNNYLTKHNLMICGITHYSVYFIYTLLCLFLKTPQNKWHLFALTINVKYVFLYYCCCSGFNNHLYGWVIRYKWYCFVNTVLQITCFVLRKIKNKRVWDLGWTLYYYDTLTDLCF